MQQSQTSAGSGSVTISPVRSVASGETIAPWCFSTGKRVFDVIVTVLALAVVWPVMLLVAVAIKLASPGPAFFRQQRIGKGATNFELLKFRSMHAGADRMGPGITSANDLRVFPLGRLLRKWKLDELPQLLNVLRGEMSLVGPRPDLPQFAARLTEEQRSILALRPGITGAATLAFRNEESVLAEKGGERPMDYYINVLYPKKVKLDLEYARKASFAGDIGILARTFAAIIR